MIYDEYVCLRVWNLVACFMTKSRLKLYRSIYTVKASTCSNSSSVSDPIGRDTTLREATIQPLEMDGMAECLVFSEATKINIIAPINHLPDSLCLRYHRFEVATSTVSSTHKLGGICRGVLVGRHHLEMPRPSMRFFLCRQVSLSLV